jgi:hypothetical protein
MVEDREVWACANLLFRQHGDEARRIATERAEALLAEGALEGYRTFLRIVERIEALETLAPLGRIH